MANTNSNLIANIIASPPVMNLVSKLGGRKRVAMDNFEIAAADIDAVADTIKLVRLPANAVPISILVFSDALDSDNALTVDCGLYTTAGVVKDANAFATASTVLQAANVAGTDLRFLGANLIDTIGDKLWECAGDSDASEGEYDIYLTVVTAATSADPGTLSFFMEYALD